MTRLPLSLSLAALAVALTACPKPLPTAMGPLDEAVRSVKEGKASPREQALAGWSAWLVAGEPERAVELWKAAAAADKVEPWSRFGLAEAARRSLDTRERVLQLLSVCEAAPKHPLCAAAARACAAATGESPSLDAAIEAGALKALERGAEGEAALLLRIAAAGSRRNRGEAAGASALYADGGLLQSATLLGPWSRHHFLEWDRAFPPEQGKLSGEGPHGKIAPHPMLAPDGRFVIYAEASSADVFYFAADVEVREAGDYLARLASRDTAALFLDGVKVGERRDFEAFLPEGSVALVKLGQGRHRLVAKLARGSDRGALIVALSRADGRPANLAFAPAQGDFSARAPLEVAAPANAWTGAKAFAEALEPEVGTTLAAFVAARDGLERDEQGAKRLVQSISQGKPGPAALVLRGEVTLTDPTLPQRLAQGRARRDLEDALRLDPGEASALQRLSVQARTEGRNDEAAEWLEKARLAASPRSWRVALSQMKLAQARGLDAAARDAADRALAQEPGLCEATQLRYDLARKLDASQEADELIDRLAGCPGYLRQLAEHRRARGDLAGAREAFDRAIRESPSDPGPRQSLAQALLALGRAREAAAVWDELAKAWPRNAAMLKGKADALERAGDAEGARAAREAALLADGSDLRLRRTLSLEKGSEVMDDLAEDGEAHLAAYRAAKMAETSPGVFILDASALEAHPDGSFTERTHALAKVVDQRGVSQLAEVNIPAGAEVLTLRTIKPDGRVLEPEVIGGKEGVSLPGVEVGDLVEWEYLTSSSSRGPSNPGFTGPKFYFRVADGQLFRSIYKVRAPAGTGLEVDAHQIEPAPVIREGAFERVSIERENVPAFVREPGGPTLEEVLPFAHVGAGAGLADMMAGFGDFLLERARPSPEVRDFAAQATSGLSGRAAVEALYAKVMAEIKGPEGSLTSSAAGTLAQGRGSRLMLTWSALQSLGIRSRIVLARPFGADQAPYRFPTADLFGTPVLEVALPDGKVYLNPGARWAPFGKIPEQVQGQAAMALPGPGEKAEALVLPGDGRPDAKTVTLRLALSAEGTLSGTGEDVYRGNDAAWLRAGLERLDQPQRRQAVESSIARVFENAVLQDFSIEEEEKPGAPVVIRYTFAAPGWAREEGGKLVRAGGVYPATLGRRWLALSERKTPLLMADPDLFELDAELSLPAGFALSGPPQSTELQGPFGRYQRTEQLAPGKLTLKESLLLPMQRVKPESYRAFGDYLTSVDKAQARELVFGP